MLYSSSTIVVTTQLLHPTTYGLKFSVVLINKFTGIWFFFLNVILKIFNLVSSY